jgi:biopolymer transport protein ExbB
MIQLFYDGGPIMYLLLFCSVVAIYIIAYKIFFLNTHFSQIQERVQFVKQQLLLHGRKKTLAMLNRETSILSQLMSQAILLANKSRDEVQDGVREALYNVIPRIESQMPILSGIITITPILGLTGTVLGLMAMFSAISLQGMGDPSVLSAGISVALITTVAGLLITLPLIIIFQYLSQKIKHQLLQLEQICFSIVTYCVSSQIE